MNAQTVFTAVILVGLAGCAEQRPHSGTTPPGPQPLESPRLVEVPADGRAPSAVGPGGPREVFPFVRVDLAARQVEFDGIVPIDAHDPQAPRVDLELIACTPDTREHEALVLTRASAANVHAALLMLGLTPGTPGFVGVDAAGLRKSDPQGPPISVLLRWKDATGANHTSPVSDWIVSARDGRRPDLAEGRFCFAGSRIVRRLDPATGREMEFYDADGAGTLIGLATFGSETVAWRTVYSPDSAISDPEWIADGRSVPAYRTAVTVILTAAPTR